jgi:hypothetical protein
MKTDGNGDKEIFCIWVMADNNHDCNYLLFIN